MTGILSKIIGTGVVVAGLALGPAASRAADIATPQDGIVASDADGDAGSLVQKAWFGCGPYRCGWHPRRYWGPRVGWWHPHPVVRCGPYHCWRRF
jgi:hypothetical protein